jgi:endonuclease/exonuclease/phosphatase family metal-dependent hydrolase
VKNLSLGLLWLCVGGTLVAQETIVRDEPLTVMTWNLEWFYDDQPGDNYSDLAKERSSLDRTRWNWRRDEIAKSIAAVRPTILAVQEVENRRVLWYLTQALRRQHQVSYDEFGIESRDFFTEQDVGVLIRPPAELVAISQHGYPRNLRSSNEYYDLTKHLRCEIDFVYRGLSHPVTIVTVHLRATAEAEPFRVRQGRLLQRWIRDAVRSGQDLIVLGDLNTEASGNETRPDSDLGILCGLETADPADDLIDLNLRLPLTSRQTHLLPGRQYDRILCSRSLLEDDPSRPDLVFTRIAVLRDLCVRGEVDEPTKHWEAYWEIPASERDLSDHFPVMATFEIR